MSKHSSKSILKHTKPDPVAEDLTTITRLVATLSNGHGNKLSDDMLFRLANLQHCPLFFCPALTALSRQTKAVHDAAKKMTGVPSIRRKDLESLSSARPLSLDRVLSVHKLLTAIAHSPHPSIRSTIEIGKKGARKLLPLGKNDVIPSLYWVNRPQLREFCKDYKLKRSLLSRLIFGDHASSKRILNDLHDGVLKSGIPHDYRITDYTCEHIYFGLRTIFNRLARYGRPLAMVMPPRSQFFVLSHTVGAGEGRHKLALPVSKGNRMTPLTELERIQIEARVDAYATRIGQ